MALAAVAERLPALNACLNALAAVLLLTGFVAIKRRAVDLHRRCMLAAFATSIAFLASYLAHKAIVRVHTPFPGDGAARLVYRAILLTHTVLAAAVVPLAIVTLRAGLRRQLERHRRLARVTFPIWLYVSITGVVIWWMLYSGTFGPVPGTASAAARAPELAPAIAQDAARR